MVMQAPKTVENFRSLATGERGTNEKGILLHYKNTTFDRVVHGLLVQGGDVMSKLLCFFQHT
jgi:cyclophilin family peptidyl-prolyl cis-trans isomerase